MNSLASYKFAGYTEPVPPTVYFTVSSITPQRAKIGFTLLNWHLPPVLDFSFTLYQDYYKIYYLLHF